MAHQTRFWFQRVAEAANVGIGAQHGNVGQAVPQRDRAPHLSEARPVSPT